MKKTTRKLLLMGALLLLCALSWRFVPHVLSSLLP